MLETDDLEEFADLIEEETEVEWPKVRAHLPELPTESLMEIMPMLGLFVNRRFALELAGREDAVFQLRRYLQEGSNWYDSEKTSRWAPVHAVHILSIVKGPEALRLLLEVLRFRSEELGDIITEDMASLLYNFGPDAWKDLKEFTYDETVPPFTRSAALRAMSARAHKDPSFRQEAVAHSRNLLERTGDRVFATMLADDLIGLDRTAIAEVKAAYRAGRLDENLSKEEEYDELARGEYNDVEAAELESDTRDPMDHFRRKNILDLKAVEESWEESDSEELEKAMAELRSMKADGEDAGDPDAPAGKKGSRKKMSGGGKPPSKNAPCPCGSGKKYKRCCMPGAKE